MCWVDLGSPLKTIVWEFNYAIVSLSKAGHDALRVGTPMDKYQFIAAVIGHLAWPSVLIALFIILRKHISSLAGRLIELSFGGAKITFDKILKEGAEIIGAAPPVSPTSEPAQAPQPAPATNASSENVGKRKLENVHRDSRNGRFTGRRLGRSAISKIIVESEKIDRTLFDIGDTIGIDAASPLSVVYALMNRGLIDHKIIELYGTLNEARNLVVHGKALPGDIEALEYVRQAEYLYHLLSAIDEKLPHP